MVVETQFVVIGCGGAVGGVLRAPEPQNGVHDIRDIKSTRIYARDQSPVAIPLRQAAAARTSCCAPGHRVVILIAGSGAHAGICLPNGLVPEFKSLQVE